MWEKRGVTYPIFVDFDITNKCNNKCPLCITSRDRNQITIAFDVARDIILQLKHIGVKAIILAGGGDPTCNPDLEVIIRFIRKNTMEIALNTNAYDLSEKVAAAIIDCCTWVRISLDADSPETYRKTHGMGEGVFYQVINNIAKLVNAKRKRRSNIIIGATYLIGPHTINGIYKAARLCKELRIDNMRFRLFEGRKKRFTKKEEEKIFDELKKCKALESKHFSASYPEDRFRSAMSEKKLNFKECYVPHIVTSITPDLKVYPCCYLKNIAKYSLGDLKEKKFKEIWSSEKKKNVLQKIDVRNCPYPCKFERHNELLHTIRQPMLHSNFL